MRRPKPVLIQWCLMVVFDGSALPFEENVTKTKQAVTEMKATHPSFVVEGELGFIGSSSSIHGPIPIGHGRRRQFFVLGDRLISKIRVSSLDRTRDAIDLVAASVDASLGIVEHAIFGKYLVYGRAPTRGVVFTEDVVKIADEQGRYAVGHGYCFSSLDRVPLALIYQAA